MQTINTRNRDAVVIVGAGMGGLAAAVDLARMGRAVTVVEAARESGGKMREVRVGGRAVDAGPTVLTMRWVVEELFADCGRSLRDWLTLRPASIVARHLWPDGATLDLFADEARSADAIGRMAGASEARAFTEFSAYARRIYETVERPFLRAQRPTAMSLVRDASALGLGLGAFARIDAHRTMMRALTDFFRDRRLLQLFGRYATYVGSSPYEAPATLHLIAHVEQRGVDLVVGGMQELARALERLARSLGVRFRFGERAAAIRTDAGRVSEVELASGERLAAGIVVLNGDAAALADGAFGVEVARAVPRVPSKQRSLSALTFAIVGKTDASLVRHNVFFSEGYAAEFDALFAWRRLPERPTVYVCAQDRADDERPAGDERFFAIVNAPANGDEGLSNVEEIERCEANAKQVLSRCGVTIETRAVVRTTPRDFALAFPSTGGALYGRAQHGMMSALSRPSARTKVPGLYLAGGSVHPGPGVPMAILSGRLAARAVADDWRSTATSRAPATPGFTSTP